MSWPTLQSLKNILSFTILVCFLFFISCTNNESSSTTENEQKPEISFESNKQMAEELWAIANNKSEIQQWHLCRERAENYDQLATSTQEPALILKYLYESSKEWLNAGEYEISIAKIEQFLNLVQENNLSVNKVDLNKMKSFLAVVNMRKGEIENCLQNHNEYSCLLPIEKSGVHKKKKGASKAQEILKALIKEEPGNLKTKWLLNIAEMALGNYPDKVPAVYKIDQSVFTQDEGIERFTDNAMSHNLAINDIAGGVIMDDFNNDHYLDLVVSSYGLDDQIQFFINDQKGGFLNKTSEAKLSGQISGLNIMQTDYNNDGNLDIFILRGAWLKSQGKHPNSLLRNNGNGTFTDVTREAGLYSKFPTQTASWADFNNDGWIDVFIGNESSKELNAPCQLFQNNKDGTFTEVAKSKRCNLRSFIKGCTSGDIDNDGDQDLFVSSITGPNFLLENLGPEQEYKFKNVSMQMDKSEMKSFPCWMFDFNQDGWQDIFVSGFDFDQFETAAGEVAASYLNMPTTAERPRLYKNLKTGAFKEISKEMGISIPLYTMGCNIGDINNDGYPDFYAATGTPDFSSLIPNQMFLNKGGSSFADITHEAGLGHLQKGHGVAIGDIDNDGDQDIYNVLGGSFDGDNFMNALFLNPNNDNYWIKLKLVGISSNRTAIGSRIKIILNSGRAVYRTVNSGGSFGSNSLMQHIGIGKDESIKEIEITWAGSNEVQKISGLRKNSYYVITQNSNEAQKITLSTLNLSLKTKDHHHHH